MVQYRDIYLKRQAREARKQDKQSFRRAVLTDEFGNQTSSNPLGAVWASEDDRRVWYMTDGAAQPGQILCRKVSDPYVGLGVIIGYADGSNQLEVLSDDFFLTQTGDPTGWASTAPRDFEPGGRKQMWVYSKVITPLATYPGSGISVNVISGDYPYLGTRKTYAGSVNFPLTSNPNAGEHYLAGLYLDAANTLQVVYGASVVVATTPPEPSWPAGAFRLSAVRVNDTQTSISFADDVFDRRMAWSDEIASSAGWPFTNILTVSTTDPEADYATLQDAIDDLSAGAVIALDAESSSETVTVNKALYIVSLARGGTVFTNPITVSAAATLVNIKVSIASGTNSKGFIVSANAVLITCEAVTSGTTTSRAIDQSAGNSQVIGGYYESTGAGTNHEVFVSGGSMILVDPILSGTSYSGNLAGTFRNNTGDVTALASITALGNVILGSSTLLSFATGTSMSDGVWLADVSAGVRKKYADLPAAAAAAAAGDSIKLDTGTYSLSAGQAIATALTLVGDGPAVTIITNSGSNVPCFDVTANLTLRNLKIIMTGGGAFSRALDIGNCTVTLDNVIIEVSSGAPTTGAGAYLYTTGAALVMKNGSKISVTSGTTKQGIRNDAGNVAITIGAGCEVGGDTADIYGDQAGSTLTNFGLLTNGKANWAGAFARANVEPAPTEPILMNGHPLVWQRGTSFAAAASGQYFADRWGYFKNGTMVHTVSQSSDVPTVAQIGTLLNYSMLADCTTIDGTIAAGDFAFLRHTIEGFDFLKIAQQQFTLPFWVKATKTGVYCVAFSNSGTDRTYVAEYTVNATDTWEYKQVTVAASPSAGTWAYTSGVGLSVTFTLAAGSTYQTTAGAWQTGGYLGTSNQVNACDDAANNFRLIVGDPIPGPYARPIVANPYGSYGALLARCQRYAYVLDATNTVNQFQGAKTATAVINMLVPFPVPMRAAPALSHNISGYTAGAPGTTTVALVNYTANAFFTITGALSVALSNANIYVSSIEFTAGTSWNGTAGDLATLRIGPSVVAVLAPSDYS